jgi:hypothetical protein
VKFIGKFLNVLMEILSDQCTDWSFYQIQKNWVKEWEIDFQSNKVFPINKRPFSNTKSGKTKQI